MGDASAFDGLHHTPPEGRLAERHLYGSCRDSGRRGCDLHGHRRCVHGLRALRETRLFVAASATGTVTDSVGLWYRNPGDNPGVWKLSHPVVRFITGEGRTVEFESAVGSNLAPKVGEQVTVFYDPRNPEEARVKSFMMLWGIPTVFAMLGAFLLVPGMLSIFLLLLAL